MCTLRCGHECVCVCVCVCLHLDVRARVCVWWLSCSVGSGVCVCVCVCGQNVYIKNGLCACVFASFCTFDVYAPVCMVVVMQCWRRCVCVGRGGTVRVYIKMCS